MAIDDYKITEIQFKDLDFYKLSEELFTHYKLPSYYIGDTFMIPSTLVQELRAAQQHLQNIEKDGIKTTNLTFMEAKEAMAVIRRLQELILNISDAANERLVIEEV